jgi:putative DNA primase/helicase
VRRCILIGTTNDDTYLRDTTGNRRFWPVKTGRIDLGALQRDRDQLWAEAVIAEKGGEPLAIPETLYAAAAEQQEQRRMKDPWEEHLANVTGEVVKTLTGVEERISSMELLTSFTHLNLAKDRITDVAVKRLATVMRRLGWQGPKKIKFEKEEWDITTKTTIKKSTSRQGYWRPAQCPAGGTGAPPNRLRPLLPVPPGSTREGRGRTR